MGKSTCSIDGCDRSVACRGWCNTHYLRWRRYGDPTFLALPRVGPEAAERTCTSCGETKSADAFYRHRNGSPHARCKACNNGESGTWHRVNRERVNAADRRRRAESDATRERERRYYAANRELVLAKNRRYRDANPHIEREAKLRRFGLTVEDYEARLFAQGGTCAVCGQPETRRRKDGEVMALAIDHDHRCCPKDRSCGRCVRALLCGSCNQAAGLLGEDSDRIRQLADYLDKWRTVEG